MLSVSSCAVDLPPPEPERERAYVFHYDGKTKLTTYGGGFDIANYVGKEDAITPGNMPNLLHPDLGLAQYMKWDPSLAGGEPDHSVFPSSWWPYDLNGIAWRWRWPFDHTGKEQRYTYDNLKARDLLSPVEKYDLVFNPGQPVAVPRVVHKTFRGTHSHESVDVAGPATAWELQNHGTYYSQLHPEAWMGHCFGWALYATVEPGGAPGRDIRVRFDSEGERVVECRDDEDGCMLFSASDVEALMTELYFWAKASVAGNKCRKMKGVDHIERDEYGRPKHPYCRDLNPGSLHVALTGLLSRGVTVNGAQTRLPFLIDKSADFEVWNHPVVRYKIHEQKEITAQEANAAVGAVAPEYQFNPDAKRFVEVHLSLWMITDQLRVGQMKRQARDRKASEEETELSYVLELAEDGEILGGEWISTERAWGLLGGTDNKRLHPDIMVLGQDHRAAGFKDADKYGEGEDDEGGDRPWMDNPHIRYSRVRKLLDCANDPATCLP